MTTSDHDKLQQATVSMRRRGQTIRVFRYNGELRIHPERKDIGDRFIVTGYRIENINDDALPSEWNTGGFGMCVLISNNEFQIEQ